MRLVVDTDSVAGMDCVVDTDSVVGMDFVVDMDSVADMDSNLFQSLQLTRLEAHLELTDVLFPLDV